MDINILTYKNIKSSKNLTYMSSTESILKVLKASSAALKAGEISEKSGIDKKEVDKIIKKLMTDGLVASPKRCFYESKA
jgi:predicted transcriptional regulator